MDILPQLSEMFWHWKHCVALACVMAREMLRKNVASPLQRPSGGVISFAFYIGLGNFWPMKQFLPHGTEPWAAEEHRGGRR